MQEELEARAAHLEGIRARAETEMQSIGITPQGIDRLVDTFYSRIRTHPTLGPVFNARLEGRWADHMPRMKNFWSSIAFKNGAYGGKPVQAHLGIDGMQETLFADWLKLFDETVRDLFADARAQAWFMQTAERIARSLILSLFYNPALDDPARKVSP